MTRVDLVKGLGAGAVVAELGVARGAFSREMLLAQPNIAHLYSVDSWARDRGHNDEEFRVACRALDLFGQRSIVIRRTFENAVTLFSREMFDVVYVDGYAHTGQDDGRTLAFWWPKVKRGGLFAGHDYSKFWPLTVKAVDAFVAKETGHIQGGLETTMEPEDKTTGIYRSWYVRKK